MRRVALATCTELPVLDPDEHLLPPALAEVGIEAVPAIWNDDSVDWDAFELVLLRSTWDYTDHLGAFLAWCERIGGRLRNPVPIVRWNTDKRYLADLAAAGVPVVETTFLEPDDDIPPLEGREIVIKPVVSAGSRDTIRHSGASTARTHVLALLAQGRPVMVQPYLRSVDAEGETALLFFDGVFSHAIRKGPLLPLDAAPTADLFAEENITPREPGADEIAVAEAVVTHVAQRFGAAPTYARVDLLRDASSAPVVLELELTEPSLFLAHHSKAPERLARAIASALP